MSLILRQTRSSRFRVDFRGLLPPVLGEIDPRELRGRPLAVGNREVACGELFEIDGEPGDELVLMPLDDRLDYFGSGLADGRITVRGALGDHAGAGMRGGLLHVAGNVGDFAGSGLSGGVLRVDGDAGDFLGAPPAGERRGQRGGLIHVRGNVGARAAEGMRRGLTVIEGDAGDLLGHRMIAGSVYVGGRAGELTGHAMRRGSLLLRHAPRSIGSTFGDNGRQRLGFLALLLADIGRQADGLQMPRHGGPVLRYLGDIACDGNGEILILEAGA